MTTSIDSITLYMTKTCPWAARVRIVLREANATFDEYEIDLKNKPDWYKPIVNPAGSVPVIAYGGPDVPADQPSPQSIKLRESLPMIEWVADVFPQSKLLPKDPVLRYKIRLFTNVITSKLVSSYHAFLYRGGSADAVIQAFETVQDELNPNTKFAVSDDFTNADVGAAPFLGRVELLLRNDVGVYAQGEGKRLHELLATDPKFHRLWSYIQAVKERDSVKSTLGEELLLEGALQQVETIKNS
ncbi:thioredoxin-like protein [Hysterangium stoloniferum]|nr:thioredoxin-like protein [Hysterangium stoloniferum]